MSSDKRSSRSEPSMRAARLHGPGDVRVERVPRPTPAGDEVRLRVRCIGICGSDLHLFREGTTGGSDSESDLPFVPGHEISAEVPEASAERLDLAPGALVAVDPAHPCGACEWCRRGAPNLCPHVRFKGAAPHAGGLAEELTARPREVVPVPSSLTADDAALLEPLGVAIHAVDLARLRPMETVAVLGAGPIGLLLAQVARRAGAGRVYVIDPLDYRADAATQLGADAAAPTPEAVAAWTDDRGADVVLEATNAPLGFQHATEAACIGGRVVLVGIPEGDTYDLAAAQARRKGLTVNFSRRMKRVYPRAIDMVQDGAVDLASLVTHRFALDDTREALAQGARYEGGVIKAVVTLDS